MTLVREQVTSSAQFHHRSTVSLRTEENASFLETAREISRELSLSLLTAKILVSRGLTSVAEARNFVSPTLREHLPDPAQVKNIEQAAALLLESTEAGKRITVYSDFDVDGLCGASQLVLFLKSLGAQVQHYVPNRFQEGYGVSRRAVEKLAESGTEVLVTVDCGITSHHELALAKHLGLKTIVIDHHELHGVPPADVVVDPLQDGCGFREHKLAAAGLVWMLLIVLRRQASERWAGEVAEGRRTIPDPKEFLDLAALGTVCDMVPLVGVNRIIAQRGIEALQLTQRLGLIALKEVAGIGGGRRLTCGHLGFGLGPRINAAGRLGDAGQVFELLVTEDSLRAKHLAEAINRLNSQRKTIEERVREECLRTIRASAGLQQGNAFALFGADNHLGVIGIVAQRIVEEFYRPAAVMGPGEEVVRGKTIPVVKGSVRSIKGFHVADALRALGNLLIRHGGHEQAGGFTVATEKLAEFQGAFVELANSVLQPEQLCRRYLADLSVQLGELDFIAVQELGKLSPFGIGNPAPLFVTRGVTIDSVTSLAQNHLRLRFTDGRHSLGAVAWDSGGHPLLRKGNQVHIAYQAGLNNYQGISSVQLTVKEAWVD